VIVKCISRGVVAQNILAFAYVYNTKVSVTLKPVFSFKQNGRSGKLDAA